MKIEEFDAFVEAVLDSAPDDVDSEWYGSDYQIAKQLLDSARKRMFEQELARQANARLIAAAPDMAAALLEFVETMDGLPSSDETSLRVWDVYHKARAAIAKATKGE